MVYLEVYVYTSKCICHISDIVGIPQHCCSLLFTETGDFRPVGLTQVDHGTELVDHLLIINWTSWSFVDRGWPWYSTSWSLRRSFKSVSFCYMLIIMLRIVHFSFLSKVCILLLIDIRSTTDFTGVVAKDATYNLADAPFYLSTIWRSFFNFISLSCFVPFFSLRPVQAKFFFLSCFVEAPFS